MPTHGFTVTTLARLREILVSAPVSPTGSDRSFLFGWHLEGCDFGDGGRDPGVIEVRVTKGNRSLRLRADYDHLRFSEVESEFKEIADLSTLIQEKVATTGVDPDGWIEVEPFPPEME